MSSRNNIPINIRTKWIYESNRLEAYTKSSTEMYNICGRNFLKIYQFLRNTAILPNTKERLWEWAREAYFGILSDQNEIENNTKRSITVCHLYWFLTSKRHNDFYLAGNIFTMISSSSNGPVPSLSKSLDASVGYMLCVEENTETASSQI